VADLSDVETALVTLVDAIVYPNGDAAASIIDRIKRDDLKLDDNPIPATVLSLILSIMD
jgi:hypothetical protein